MRHLWLVKPSNKREFDKALSKLPRSDKLAVFDSLAKLAQAENPCAVPGVKRITTSESLWRQRQGDYRILFEIRSDLVIHLKCEYRGTIFVENVQHRKDVYR